MFMYIDEMVSIIVFITITTIDVEKELFDKFFEYFKEPSTITLRLTAMVMFPITFILIPLGVIYGVSKKLIKG